MNDPIEKLLQQMVLKEPGRNLDRRIEKTLNGSDDQALPTLPVHQSTTSRPGWYAVAVSSLACSVIGFVVGSIFAAGNPAGPSNARSKVQETEHSAPLPIAGSQPDPIQMAQTKPDQNPVRLRDGGLVLLNGTNPVRRYYATTLHPVNVTDPQTGKRKTTMRPVQQIVLTPDEGA